jgi:hypothetical protein
MIGLAEDETQPQTSQPAHTQARSITVWLNDLIQYSSIGDYRLRVGDYRLIHDIDGERREVVILRVMHRRDIYRER